jgi:hypothetical protein
MVLLLFEALSELRRSCFRLFRWLFILICFSLCNAYGYNKLSFFLMQNVQYMLLKKNRNGLHLPDEVISGEFLRDLLVTT